MSEASGINHVAVLTQDLARFVAFYTEVFELEIVFEESTPVRHAILRTGEQSWLHPVEFAGNPHASAVPAMFERGHLDHLGLTAASRAAFERVRQRLVDRGASTGSIDDLGPFQSLWFTDPDGMRGEWTLVLDETLHGIHAPRPLGAGAGSGDGT
jgi:catechol 2,3-dioxygenase-like lactoylglutathione lyase family enzyme